MILLAAFILVALMAGALFAVESPRISQAPAEEKLSDDFELKVGGKPVPVYQCRVSAIPFNRLWPGHQRPLDQTELASFATWDMSGPVTVEITSRRAVESIAVRPSSRAILPAVEGNRITFEITTPGQLTVEINGWHFALHLFANPPEAAAPSPKDPNVRYFGPGLHKPGEIKLRSNQTVYLAAGAVVQSSIQATGASNIKILGRGILDSSIYERGKPGDPSGCIRLTDCRDITIDGIILRDPNMWCLTVTRGTNVAISNVKLIGLWRYNSDGIDFCNCQNVTLSDSFIRSYDDSIVIKGLVDKSGKESPPVKNVLVERCVTWCDWGRALEIGAETVADEMSDITFRDCDVIHTNVAAMDIQHGDRAAIKNVLFENIRMEIDDENGAPLIQKSDEDPYKPDLTWIPRLFIAEIVSTMWNHDKVRGTIDGVTLRNITVTGKPFPPSRLQGFDAEHLVKNVSIENLRVNWEPITTAEAAHLTLKPFAENARFVPAGG